jgi:uncharacterized protein
LGVKVDEMIEKLLTMQKLDLELDQLRAGASVYPTRLSAAQTDFSEKQKKLEALQLQIETSQKAKGDLEETLRLEEIRLKKSKLRINEIKTNYEYQAMRREIETTERTNKELEEQILKKAEEVEIAEKQIAQYMEECAASEKILSEVSTEATAKGGEFEGILKVKESEQKMIETGIDRAILSKYRMIRQRKYRDALVEVISGACQGCFMNVPPQMANEILRRGGIYQCPNCQRLLYSRETKH